jgi:hypothetical protein
MSDPKSSRKLLIVLAAAVLGVAGLCAVGSAFFLKAIGQKADERRQEKRATLDMLDAIGRAAEGEQIATPQGLPDTPSGRMNALLFAYLQSEQQRQSEFEKNLEKIGWDWVMTADSLKSAADVRESLRRLDRARAALARYYREVESAYADFLRDLEKEATDETSKKFLAGFKQGASQPESGLYFVHETGKVIRVNHDNLEKALRHLLKLEGRYRAEPDGNITFYETVSDADVARYNEYIDAANEAMAQIEKLEQDRIRRVQTIVERGKQSLR